MDGTFYLGERLLPGARRFIETVQALGKEYLFLTNNSSNDRRAYAEKISQMGISIPEDRILTSGEATASYLVEKAPGKRLFVVGTASLRAEFRSRGFILDSDHPDITVLGFDTTLTYQKLWRLCDLVREGIPYIATHPDANCPTETGYMPDIGAMIAFVRASTGRDPDEIIGKPNRWIVEAAARKLGLPVEALGMIGDRLYTDIALGLNAGIPALLVLSGETKPADVEGSPFKPTSIFKDVGEIAGRLLEG